MATLNPKMLEWAARRSGLSDGQVTKAFPKFPQWLDGTWKPTVRQLRDFAGRVHVSVRDLFARERPDHSLQIADFRTVGDAPAEEPSPGLFDTADAMLDRQGWMRGYFSHEGFPAISYVGSYQDAPLSAETAERLARDTRRLLRLDADWARSRGGSPEALRLLKDRVEAAGISVAINGVVGDNTHRTLSVAEFRGFALADPLAPIIFVNGRDVKSAQTFTLLHEMCHLAFAQTGVSNAPDDEEPRIKMERLCNSAAAEFLVPKGYLAAAWGYRPGTPYDKAEAIARDCKVSLVVVARKARDDGIVGEDEFLGLCRRYKGSLDEGPKRTGKGGNYYLGKQYRLGSVFSDAVRSAVNSDYLSHRDAYDLTGLSAPSFRKHFEGVA